MREELQKAYDSGANKLWVINVGDIKPSEIALEFVMRLAWSVTDFTEANVADFVAALAARDFGPSSAAEITGHRDALLPNQHRAAARSSWARPPSTT